MDCLKQLTLFQRDNSVSILFSKESWVQILFQFIATLLYLTARKNWIYSSYHSQMVQAAQKREKLEIRNKMQSQF